MRKQRKFSGWTLLKVFIMLFICVITIYPFIYMASVSVSSEVYVLGNAVWLYPKGFNLEAYKVILASSKLWLGYKQTIIYVALGTAISLAITSTGAYALSKRNKLVFCKQLNIMVLVTMFFGGGMIPNFLNVMSLNLIDKMLGIILPVCCSAWNLIVMRSFFQAYPQEIEDSGYVDGLNDFGVFYYLVLPTSKAVLATIGLFYAVAYWNAFYTPYLYLNTPSKYPLQCVLREIVLAGTALENTIDPNGKEVVVSDALRYGTIIVSVLPIICVYPFIQKYFVKGVMVGSIKG